MKQTWILITGASSGIGRACVEYLSTEDKSIQIVATARQKEDIDELNQLPNVRASYLDVTDTDSIEELLHFLDKHEIVIEVLINNAAILRVGPLLEMPLSAVEEVFQTNVFSVISMCQKLLPHLQKKSGKIINISSDEGLVTHPYTVLYSMSKFAIEALTMGLREELRKTDIDVTMIEPGNIATPIMDKALSKIDSNFDFDPWPREEIKMQLKESAEEFKTARQPSTIASRLHEIILSDKTRKRYFDGSKDETTFVIEQLFETIIDIQKTSPHGLSEEELREKFEFAVHLN